MLAIIREIVHSEHKHALTAPNSEGVMFFLIDSPFNYNTS